MVNFWHASCLKRIAALVILHYKAASRIDIGVGAGEMPRRLVRAFPNLSGLPWIFMSAPLSCRSAWTGFRPTSIRPTFTKQLAGKPMLSMRPPSGSMSVSRISSRKTLSSCSMAAGCLSRLSKLGQPGPQDTRHQMAVSYGRERLQCHRKGAESCLQRSYATARLTAAHIASRPILLTYSLIYTAKRFGLQFADIIPRFLRMPMPAGRLEAVAICVHNPNTSR